jgi:hypothetical protein
MKLNIKPKEAAAIINSLTGGVVPGIGVQHIAVGRTKEINAALSTMDDVKNGLSAVKFWIGDYGSGKSFMLHLINTVALKQKFVVSNADFTPTNRLYANDGKALALYSAVMNSLSTQTRPEGGALPLLLEKWIEQAILMAAEENGIPLPEIRDGQYLDLIRYRITKNISTFTDVGGFDFSSVIIRYYEGYVNLDDTLQRNALKWLKGEYHSKLEARQDLGVREIISDLNYYDMLKNFCKLFISMGYSGFMINLDEMINLYKISTSVMREKNYEKILTIYNDCLQGKISGMYFNFAGTDEVLENPRRGFFSYSALKTRLESNKYETSTVRDFAQPVIRLLPLNHDEIFVLLQKLSEIFNFNYGTQIEITDAEIFKFMETIFNKPGASEFLTPREVIRDFLNILNIVRQNPEADKNRLFNEMEISDERPDEDPFDGIEEL